MIPQEIIRIKRNNKELSVEEIKSFIEGISNHEVDDIQVAALTMAVFLNGFSARETVALTLAMRDSGEVLDWSDVDKPVADKHSSGGVGDKTSLMIGPILAACDVCVPMVCGRGLGHTGGTVDKLESIPGYNTQADTDLFKKVVKKVGYAEIGQTGNLAPADKKIYAIRDVCATVESIPLITASILSKKLAEGIDYLIMDLKCGNGAFMQTFADAEALAKSIVAVAGSAGTKTSAIITDMNQVLGYNVGNALEVAEAIEFLKDNRPNKRLNVVTKSLCSQILVQCGRCKTQEQADKLVEGVIVSGKALEKFAEMISELGAPNDFTEKYHLYLPKAAIIRPIYADESGFVSAMDVRNIGLSIIKMNGGRTVPNQKLDLATGYTDFVQIGDKVDSKTPLAVVHCQSEEQYETVKADILQNITISAEPVKENNPIISRVV